MAERIVRSIIVCDDVRQEVNGKFTLVGCYSDGLTLHSELPANLPQLCFVFIVDGPATAKSVVRVQMRLPRRKPLVEIESEIGENEGTSALLGFQWRNPVFHELGKYTIQLFVAGRNVFSAPFYVRQRLKQTAKAAE